MSNSVFNFTDDSPINDDFNTIDIFKNIIESDFYPYP